MKRTARRVFELAGKRVWRYGTRLALLPMRAPSWFPLRKRCGCASAGSGLVGHGPIGDKGRNLQARGGLLPRCLPAVSHKTFDSACLFGREAKKTLISTLRCSSTICGRIRDTKEMVNESQRRLQRSSGATAGCCHHYRHQRRMPPLSTELSSCRPSRFQPVPADDRQVLQQGSVA